MKFYNWINESKKLPDYIVKKLLMGRPDSFKKEIEKLPIITKGKYIGNMKPQDCETNTKKYVKSNKSAKKYEGYLIWYDKDGWNIVSHTFPVVDDKVIEVTKLEDDMWDENTYYIGKMKK